MGKAGEEQSGTQLSTVDAQTAPNNVQNQFRICGLVRFRCVFVLLLALSVLLSAVFWLPPFFRPGDQADLDLDSMFGDHDIVASFMLDKPVSLLEDNILQLGKDIFDEIGVPTTKVEIISTESLAGSNTTKVVFGVDSSEKNSRISSAAKSLIRASFVSLLIRQSSLRLTASLFGDPFSFKVLKFNGGITVSPQQSAFPLQKVQISFNFTLNFSIDQIQYDFNELTSQLRSGLHLAPYENLYISLTNSRGSTVDPPTTVQSKVLLAVGNAPSVARLKQLAQTIKDSHAKNLGLNNTEFGRVKQVRLSPIPQHSLNGGNGPSPAPLPHPHHHHHPHQHHHHHHYPHNVHIPPAIPPAPASEKGGSATKKGSHRALAPGPAAAPQAQKSREAAPPGCHFLYRKRVPRKENMHSHLVPPVAPPISPPYTAPLPHLRVHPPAHVPHLIPVSSPLPHVVFAHTQPPSNSQFDAEPPDLTPSVLPLQSSSCAGVVPTPLWAIAVFLVLALFIAAENKKNSV